MIFGILPSRILKIELEPGAPAPKRYNEFEPYLDLCASKIVIIPPLKRRIVPTGVHLEIFPKHIGLLKLREDFAAWTGLQILCGMHTIDSNFRGEINVLLLNTTKQKVIVHYGERFAEVVVLPCIYPVIEYTQKLTPPPKGCDVHDTRFSWVDAPNS